MGFPLDERHPDDSRQESSAKTEAIGCKVLVVYPERCAGCRLCETICSLINDGEINPLNSRIHTVRREWKCLYVPVVCQQCEPPVCRSACPSKAISRHAETGAMLIDANNCSLCGSCEKACPFGAIHLYPERKAVLVCDLCGGQPKCAEWCPQKALQYSSLDLLARREVMDRILVSLDVAKGKTEVAVRRR